MQSLNEILQLVVLNVQKYDIHFKNEFKSSYNTF